MKEKLSKISLVYKPILLSLGSNIGDKKQYLELAVESIALNNAYHNVQVSSVYETDPIGFTEQDSFLNIALCMWTLSTPLEVFMFCKEIEKKLGRTKRQQWREREIDIDIILFGEEVVETSTLTIPHKAMHERKFVLAPSVEIAPHLVHPLLKKSIQELYEECSDVSSVIRVGDLRLPL